MAGRLTLIQAAYAQNRGIGRHMKIGKEGIIGLIVALQAWETHRRADVIEQEKARMQRIVARLAHLPGIQATTVWPEPDPYPIMRAKITVDSAIVGLNAMALTVLLGDGNPSIKTRAHHVDEGYFLIDPFTITDDEASFICERIEALVQQPLAQKETVMQKLAGLSAADLWSKTTGEWPFI